MMRGEIVWGRACLPLPLRETSSSSHPAQVIQLSGYTLEEKVHIASRHLMPRLLEEHGLSPANLVLGDDVMQYIVDK